MFTVVLQVQGDCGVYEGSSHLFPIHLPVSILNNLHDVAASPAGRVSKPGCGVRKTVSTPE